MREHKYRAWDTIKKVMYSPEELGQDQETLSVDGRGFVNVSGDSTKLSQFHKHLLPLEFTGLKDKNGVEIYEGDIIKSDKYNYPHKVIYTFGSFEGKQLRGKFKGYASGLFFDRFEVIGNIYENKELLNGK